jgi:hypothetical protein
VGQRRAPGGDALPPPRLLRPDPAVPLLLDGVTSFKPNAELYDYKTYNPFWIASPTLDHIRKLLFDTAYRAGCSPP